MKVTKSQKKKIKLDISVALTAIRVMLAVPLNDEEASQDQFDECAKAYEGLEILEKYFSESSYFNPKDIINDSNSTKNPCLRTLDPNSETST